MAIAFFVKRSGAIRISIFVGKVLELLKVSRVSKVDGLQEVVEFSFEMVGCAQVVGECSSCVFVVVSVDAVCGIQVFGCPNNFVEV